MTERTSRFLLALAPRLIHNDSMNPSKNPKNEIMSSITGRRSIRSYTGEPVDDGLIMTLLEAARWAPSGLNNQPWRFVIIRDRAVRERISNLTTYRRIVRECDACVAVFFHAPSGYDRDKDMMGIGAAVQNMLLAAHSLGLGAVWLGEILKRKGEVNTILGVDSDHELMAVVAFGHPAENPESDRIDLESLIIKRL